MAAASVNPLVKPIGIAACVIAIVQGIVWTILALCAILIYLKAWKPPLESKSYGQSLSTEIVALYLTNEKLDLDVFIDALQFFVWTLLYLVLSIMWTSISVYLISALMGNKVAVIKKTFLAWSICTAIVCVCDLVLASLIASDYNYLVGFINRNPVLYKGPGTYMVLASGVVMTLVARGFVLWIVNVTFTVIIVYLSSSYSNQMPTNAYNNHPKTVNPFGATNTPEQGYHNPNYNTWDANKPDFTRSDSFITGPSHPGPSHPGPEHLSKLPPTASTNERLAKIGRQGAKSPPHNIPPPKLPQSYIYPTQPRVPSPDYSPPNSPLQTPLKSALKSRSQNAYGYSNGRY